MTEVVPHARENGVLPEDCKVVVCRIRDWRDRDNTRSCVVVLWYMGQGLAQPPYEGFVAIYGVLFVSSLASLLGIWRPARWLAAVVATVLLGLGTLTAPSNGGMFVVLAFPVGLVGLFGLIEEKAGRITPRGTARHHNEEP